MLPFAQGCAQECHHHVTLAACVVSCTNNFVHLEPKWFLGVGVVLSCAPANAQVPGV